MIIKESPGRQRALLQQLKGRWWWLVLAGLLYSAALLGAGVWLHRSGKAAGLWQTIRAYPHLAAGWFDGLRANPETLTLDLKHLDYQRLAYQREQALERGILNYEPEEGGQWVKATLAHGNQRSNIKLRLKGNVIIALKGEKWPFRVKLTGDETLFGMKRFSLFAPEEKGFLNEWLFHTLLADLGVPHLRYRFVDLVVNGRDLGIYALEEHFSDELMAVNRLREGPIIRLEESWTHFKHFLPERGLDPEAHAYRSAQPDTHNPKSDSAFQRQLRTAYQLLQAFRTKQLPTSQVFDTRKLADFMAVADLFGYKHHALEYRNVRLYYNPATSRLEPIGYDQRFLQPVRYLIGSGKAPDADSAPGKEWEALFFADPVFYEAYVQSLNKVSSSAWLQGKLQKHEAELKTNLRLIHADHPAYQPPTQQLSENAAAIRKYLNPTHGLAANLEPAQSDTLTLVVGNRHYLPLTVHALLLPDSSATAPLQTVHLAARAHRGSVPTATVKFLLPARYRPFRMKETETMQLQYRVRGLSETLKTPVRLTPFSTGAALPDDLLRQPNSDLSQFSQNLEVDEEQRTITFKKGRQVIDRPLLIGPGYNLICRTGTTLDLMTGGLIITRSSLNWTGTQPEPVLITSSDGTGQGIVVLQAADTSRLEFVETSYLRSPRKGNWSLTGALTFYESPVRLRNCYLHSNQSEDALNVIRTAFQLEHTRFEHTSSDAVDIDFGQGTVRHCSFLDLGNDALDLAGSYVEVREMTVTGAGDKGLSIGEASKANVSGFRIFKSAIGITAKDESEITLTRAQLKDVALGFAVYQKKPEFGEASIRASQVTMERVHQPWLVEHGSRFMLNRKRISPNRKQVKELLYGNEFGKKSIK